MFTSSRVATGQPRLAGVTRHRQQETAIDFRESSPGRSEHEPADSTPGLGNPFLRLCRADTRRRVGHRLPSVKADQLDHEGVARSGCDRTVQRVRIDCGAPLFDWSGQRQPGGLAAQAVDVITGAPLEERHRVVRQQTVLDLRQGGPYERNRSPLPPGHVLEDRAELADLVEFSALHLIEGDDQSCAVIGEDVTERRQHRPQVADGRGLLADLKFHAEPCLGHTLDPPLGLGIFELGQLCC